MALFAVIALKDAASAIDEAIGKLPATDVYKIESGKWMVDSKATIAKELSISLGLREMHTHLVLAIRGYSGRAQPDLWEWLVAKSAKSDG
jgi:hypothetical protein